MNTPSKNTFDLSLFAATNTRNKLTTRVGVPRCPFRVRPGHRTDDLNFILRNGLWWLVSAEVAERCNPENILKGPLCEGVYQDGRTILVPMTGEVRQLQDSGEVLESAVSQAEHHWVKIETGYYECTMTVCDIKATPEWSSCTLPELVQEAFEGQIIETVEDYYAMFPKPVQVVEEDI